MEDDFVISKKQIFFIIILIIAVIGVLFYIYFINNDVKLNNLTGNTDNDTEDKKEDNMNRKGVYGKFVNDKDPYSYFEYKEDGTFVFVLNACESRITYTEEDYNITNNINKNENGEYTVEVVITSKVTLAKEKHTFTGTLIDATGLVIEYRGPYSCSPDYNYKRI